MVVQRGPLSCSHVGHVTSELEVNLFQFHIQVKSVIGGGYIFFYSGNHGNMLHRTQRCVHSLRATKRNDLKKLLTPAVSTELCYTEGVIFVQRKTACCHGNTSPQNKAVES